MSEKTKLPKPKCVGLHKILEVEEFHELGFDVRCLECGRHFHTTEDAILRLYVEFRHVSGSEGPDGDREILILEEYLDE